MKGDEKRIRSLAAAASFLGVDGTFIKVKLLAIATEEGALVHGVVLYLHVHVPENC